MLQKKVCMIGSFAVGKTSLVRRFVHSMFSQQYLTTVGVKIDKKTVSTPKGDVNILLWDLHGDDEFQRLQATYLRGTSACLLVVDGLRAVTLQRAEDLNTWVQSVIGTVPTIFVLNKADMRARWEVDDAQIARLRQNGRIVIETSAKSGEGVEEVFLRLTNAMLGEK